MGGNRRRTHRRTSGALSRAALGRRGRRGGRSAGLQYVRKRGAVGRTKAAGCIPSRSRIVANILKLLKTDAIVPDRDIVKRGRFGRQRINLGIHKADPAPKFLIDPGDQRGPERGDGARSTFLDGLAVHKDVVAGVGVPVGGYIGNAATLESPWI